jgi:hypothetical protein
MVSQAARRLSTVPSSRGAPRFTGRDAELAMIEAKLGNERVVVLHGAPGLGKTRLAQEYAQRYADRYPGGLFFIPFDHTPPLALAKLLRTIDSREYADESLEDHCRRALYGLGAAGRVLLIYDAVPDEGTLRAWLPFEGLDWHLLGTSTSANWATSWSTVRVGPLQPAAGPAHA